MKALSIIVKLAGATICAPVTWRIAGEVFSDIQPAALQLVMQFAALVLVEFVFLSAWIMLDTERNAPQEIRNRYAVTTIVMYAMLWLLAIQHGEGLAGIALRASLGLAVLGSIYDSGILTILKRDQTADRDINKDWRVKREARKAARADKILEIRLASELFQITKKMEFSAMRETSEMQINLARKSNLDALKKEGMGQRQNQESAGNTERILRNGNRAYPIASARQRRKMRADDRQNLLADLTAADPNLSKRELIKIVQQQSGIGVDSAREDVRRFLASRDAILPVPLSAGNGHRG